MVDVRSEPEFQFLARVMDRRRLYAIGVSACAALILLGIGFVAVDVTTAGLALAVPAACLIVLFVRAWKAEPRKLLERAHEPLTAPA